MANPGRAHPDLSNTEKMIREIGTEKTENSSLGSELSSHFDELSRMKNHHKPDKKTRSNNIDFGQIIDQHLSQTEYMEVSPFIRISP